MEPIRFMKESPIGSIVCQVSPRRKLWPGVQLGVRSIVVSVTRNRHRLWGMDLPSCRLLHDHIVLASIAVPELLTVTPVADTELYLSRPGWKSEFEGECVIDDFDRAGDGRIGVGDIRAECVFLGHPTVRRTPDENFLLEWDIFYFDSTNDSLRWLFDDYILQRHEAFV